MSDRDGADLERVGGVDGIELHQAADRVLPFGGAPEEDEADHAAGDGRNKLGGEQETRLGLGQFEIAPEPVQEEADAVAGGGRAARQHALREVVARNERRRQRRREEQRADEQAGQRERLKISDRPTPKHAKRRFLFLLRGSLPPEGSLGNTAGRRILRMPFM